MESQVVKRALRFQNDTIDNSIYELKWKTMRIDFRRSLLIDFLSIGSLAHEMFNCRNLAIDFVFVSELFSSHDVNEIKTLNQTIEKDGKSEKKSTPTVRERGVEIMDYSCMLDVYVFFFLFKMNGIHKHWQWICRKTTKQCAVRTASLQISHCKGIQKMKNGHANWEYMEVRTRQRGMGKRTFISRFCRWMRIPLTKHGKHFLRLAKAVHTTHSMSYIQIDKHIILSPVCVSEICCFFPILFTKRNKKQWVFIQSKCNYIIWN